MQTTAAIQVLFDHYATRAHNEGRDAFQKGQPRQAPRHVGTYAGNWVAGWIEASLEADAPKFQLKRAA
jgi:hypothetical protein